MNNNYIVGIDIGSSAIYGVIGKADKQGKLKILANTEVRCDGVKKGIVVNISSVAEALKECLEKMERIINLYIDEVFLGIPSGMCKLVSSTGIVAISNDEEVITNNEIKRVLNEAKVISIGKDEKVIDIIPEKFIIDDSYEISNPLNMKGNRLEVVAKVVVCNELNLSALYKCFEEINVNVKGTMLQIHAASSFVLTQDDRRETVAIVDVGAQTTNLAIYKNGALVHMNSFELGGDNITGDIMYCTKVSFKEAEEFKKQYEKEGRNISDILIVRNGDEYTLQGDILCDIIEARIEEILGFIEKDLKESPYSSNITSVILYGGGVSSYESLENIWKKIFNKPIYVLNEDTIDLEKPLTINSLGIVKHVFNELKLSYNKEEHIKEIEENTNSVEDKPKANNKSKNKSRTENKGFMGKVKSFFDEYF
ncbi:cell division protein FtsA [Clostridium frigidicarnis]|uniref:Cell division protein FtsA n=1 Tax=Clostridium frigidicarnis TaxID=84698 RepID=A0A1I0VNA5_9CLOT|nr:cell division protein FtsA [Clostridium frigidicarnis]SFA77822.1 cell division protein FtsA [Clostridium frigidicarnis]